MSTHAAVPAQTRALDFSKLPEDDPRRPRRANGQPKKLSKKQIRARARRAKRRAERLGNRDGAKAADQQLAEEMALLYKPVEEWDAEELARGRPRNERGAFDGPKPAWVTRAISEESVNRFREMLVTDMQTLTREGLETVERILKNEDQDRRGRPVIPASTKLDAAKFLIEHAVGKPKQRVEGDISVKLQGLLATAVVVPGALPERTRGEEEAQLRYVQAYASGSPEASGASQGTSMEDEDEIEEAELVD